MQLSRILAQVPADRCRYGEWRALGDDRRRLSGPYVDTRRRRRPVAEGPPVFRVTARRRDRSTFYDSGGHSATGYEQWVTAGLDYDSTWVAPGAAIVPILPLEPLGPVAPPRCREHHDLDRGARHCDRLGGPGRYRKHLVGGLHRRRGKRVAAGRRPGRMADHHPAAQRRLNLGIGPESDRGGQELHP